MFELWAESQKSKKTKQNKKSATTVIILTYVLTDI